MTTSEEKIQKTLLINNIAIILKEKRPDLSTSSFTTYSSLLTQLLKRLKLPMVLTSFKKYKQKILKDLKTNEQSEQTNKTRLSALYVLTDIEAYNAEMRTLCKIVNDRYKEQTLTEKQQKNRISFDEVKNKVISLRNTVDDKPTLENHVNYILLSLMSGVNEGVPPRRNEYRTILISDYDTEKDNYIKKNVITFNNYKTSNKYGQQRVTIPDDLYKYVKELLNLNESKYLFSHKNKMLSSSSLTKLIHKIFDDKIIGADQLRSIFLSEKYEDLPKLDEMDKLATKMGHSFKTAMLSYVKK
jgi:hypothetical protein